MNGMKANDQLAENYLNIALENNQFDYYIFSTPLYDLKTDDGYGNSVHSAKHVMEAIYNKYREDPTVDFRKMIYDTVTNNLVTYKYHPCILNLLENLEYHIHSEKNGTAAFDLDCVKLLDTVKKHLNENQETYKIATKQHGPNGLWPQLELFNVRMQQSSGRKIL